MLRAAVSGRLRLSVISRASVVARLVSLLWWSLCARLEGRRERRLESGRVVKRRALHIGWLLPRLCIIRLLNVLLLRRLRRRRRWLVVLLIPTASLLLLVRTTLQLLYVLILFIRLTSALILSTAVSLFTTALASATFAAAATTTAGVFRCNFAA